MSGYFADGSHRSITNTSVANADRELGLGDLEFLVFEDRRPTVPTGWPSADSPAFLNGDTCPKSEAKHEQACDSHIAERTENFVMAILRRVEKKTSIDYRCS